MTRILSTLLCAWLLSSVVFAQDALILSPETIRARIDAVKADTTIDETQRQKILPLLEEAANSLRAATSYETTAAELDQTLQQAPATLETIRQELASPIAPLELSAEEQASLSALEQRFAQVSADADAARLRLTELEADDKRQATRRATLPSMLTDATARREILAEKLAALTPDPETPEAVASANRWALLMAERAARAEATVLEKELNGYDTLRTLLTARRDRATRRLNSAEAKLVNLRQAVDERRRAESEEAAAKANETRRAAARLDPAIQTVAEKNAELAALRAGEDGLSAKLRKATKELQAAKDSVATIKSRSEELKQRIDAAGLTHAMAQWLMQEKELLPDTGNYHSAIRARKEEIARVQLKLIELGNQRAELRDIGAKGRQLSKEIALEQRADAEVILTEYLTVQRNQIDTLIEEYNSYFRTLVDLDAAERQLVETVETFSDAITEHILWVRSDQPFGLQTPGHVLKGLSWLTDPKNYQALGRAFLADLKRHPFMPALFLFAEAALLLYYIFSRRRLKNIATRVVRIRTDRFIFTLETLLHTAIRALPIPLALYYLSWRLGTIGSEHPFVSAFASACLITAEVLLAHTVVYEAIARKGLSEAHFGWEPEVIKPLRRATLHLMLTAIPLLWLTVLLHNGPMDAELPPLERLNFAGVQIVLILFALRVFGRRSKMIPLLAEWEPDHRFVKFRWPILLAGLAIPFVILIATLSGYYYTAMQIAGWFAKTISLVLGVLLLESLLIRLIRVISRRAEFERRVRERQEQARQRETAGQPLESPPPEGEEVDFIALSENTKKLLRLAVGYALLFGMWLIWVEAVPALGVLDRIVLWKVIAEGGDTFTAISLANLIFSAVVVMLTIAAARHLPGLLELAVLRQLPIAYGERYAISTIIRYLTIAIGISIAFSMLGIGWSKIRWLIAALSVGLGFGLQEIFANFVSGLILLFERPIRVRDYVTVNGTSGQVTRIQIRATTITDWDNKELLIPNKQFVTGELVNWTLTNPVLRVVIPVGIAYGSDTKKAESILFGIGRAYRLTVTDPPPTAYFVGFGDSALNFELRVFIDQADHFMLAKHELHMAVDAAFRKAGITIAFPQLDLHVKEGIALHPGTPEC